MASFYTWHAFTQKLFHTASFYTKTLVHTERKHNAQHTSLYYFELQDLRKILPSTTLYYEPCTKYFPGLLCTTKLAHSTFLYYFVLQDLHKGMSSSTLYDKACTKHFPVSSALYLRLHFILKSRPLQCDLRRKDKTKLDKTGLH